MLFLFDIDGTLLHCGGAGRRALERACEALLGPGALVGIRLDGMTDPVILEQAFVRRLQREPTAAESDQVARDYAAFLQEETAPPRTIHKLPAVDEVLAHLAPRGILGLATGNWRAGARIKLERVALWQRFTLGGFGCDAADRGALVRVARQRGEEALGRRLQREEVLVIGDTPRDVAAARAADAWSVAVATGAYSMEELARSGADEVHADLRPLLSRG